MGGLSARLVNRWIDIRARRKVRRYRRRAHRRHRRGIKARKGFEARLYAKWRPGLDWLDLYLWLVIDEMRAFNARALKGADTHDDAKYEALKRLQARACRVTSEVSALLRTGHAEAAMGRWRTLHEIAVTASFLAAHDDTLSLRFLEHSNATRWAAMKQYDRHAEALGSEPFAAHEHDEAQAERDRLVDLYGPAYPDDYGWAASVLSRTRRGKPAGPTFADIERAVGMDHHRPWYRWASEHQHAGAHALAHPMGNLDPDRILLTGQSDAGLTEPGMGAAASLSVATVVFLSLRPDVETVATMKALSLVSQRVREAWVYSYENIDYSTPPRAVA